MSKPKYDDPVIEGLSNLVGNTAFEMFLDAMIIQSCMTDPDSKNGEQALRAEGERALAIKINNIYNDLKNGDLDNDE